MCLIRPLLLRVVVVSVFALPFTPFVLAGCSPSVPPKSEDPAEIEKMRKSYEDMSKRERQGS